MSANAYNPKVSVLVKLAELFGHCRNGWYDGDDVDVLVQDIIDDTEVLEWYDRMADLQHVPARLNEDGVSQSRIDEAVSNLRGVPATHNAVLALAIEDKLKSDSVIAEATQGRIYSNDDDKNGLVLKPDDWLAIRQIKVNEGIAPRVGYQVFATQGSDVFAEDVASYTEAVSVDEAMQKCLEQFPVSEGYTAHGVKDIETQVVTMATEAVGPASTVLDLD